MKILTYRNYARFDYQQYSVVFFCINVEIYDLEIETRNKKKTCAIFLRLYTTRRLPLTTVAVDP